MSRLGKDVYYDSRPEYALHTVGVSNLTSVGRLVLRLFKFFRWDGRFVTCFYKILRRFAPVLFILQNLHPRQFISCGSQYTEYPVSISNPNFCARFRDASFCASQ